MDTNKDSPPWYAIYPTPTSTATIVSRDQVLSWLQDEKTDGEVLLVDLRRTDYEGGTIQGALNLPAQSFYGIRPTLLKLVSAAGIRNVVFYCSSSRGRGPRAAGWFQDYIIETGQETKINSCVLEGGIKGWARAGDEHVAFMVEYDPKVWEAGSEV